MDDNLYPVSSAFLPSEPGEQQSEKLQEATQVQAQAPLIRALFERLEASITFYDSVDSIPDEVIINDEAFRMAVLANKQTKQHLEREKSILEGILEDYDH